MKFIKDVDTGEVFPVPDNVEEQINDEMSTLYKDNAVPIMKADYSGVDGVNDLMLQMANELEEEKERKTVYHKFPFAKIITTVAVCAMIIVSCAFGVHYVSSINFVPTSISAENSSEILSDKSTEPFSENLSETPIKEPEESSADNTVKSSEEKQAEMANSDTNSVNKTFKRMGAVVIADIILILCYKIALRLMYGY